MYHVMCVCVVLVQLECTILLLLHYHIVVTGFGEYYDIIIIYKYRAMYFVIVIILSRYCP